MSNFDSVLANLRQERNRLNNAIAALEGLNGSNGSATRQKPKRKFSAAGLARIAAAQRKRWALIRGKGKKH
jgi:hypothetical protein